MDLRRYLCVLEQKQKKIFSSAKLLHGVVKSVLRRIGVTEILSNLIRRNKDLDAEGNAYPSWVTEGAPYSNQRAILHKDNVLATKTAILVTVTSGTGTSGTATSEMVTSRMGTSGTGYQKSRRYAHGEDEIRCDIEKLTMQMRYAIIDEFNLI